MDEILYKILGTITKMQADLVEIKKSQTRTELKVEQSLEPKIQVLFEDRDTVHNKLDDIIRDIQDIKERQDKQEFEIKLVKRKEAK